MKAVVVELPVNHCKKCGHEWVSRVKKIPQQCPKCKRYNWNEDKKSV